MYGRSEHAENQACDKTGPSIPHTQPAACDFIKEQTRRWQIPALKPRGIPQGLCAEAVFVSIQRESKQEKTHIDD